MPAGKYWEVNSDTGFNAAEMIEGIVRAEVYLRQSKALTVQIS